MKITLIPGTVIKRLAWIIHEATRFFLIPFSCSESCSVGNTLPPRQVAEHITFAPELDNGYCQSLKQTSTWMAAQAKFVATYPEAFWRSRGLSGDGFSQCGPLAEIHDASSASGDQAALFGFVGVPKAKRCAANQDIRQAAVDQLTRMFGMAASQPLDVYYKDWALDSLTCSPLDLTTSTRVPHMFDLTRWNDSIIWAGSETASTATHANGYMEGAVESAERAARTIVELHG